MVNTVQQRIHQKLTALYGADRASDVLQDLLEIVRSLDKRPEAHAGMTISERDVMLIAYADHVRSRGESPLKTLRRFLKDTIHPYVNCLHILPFYPYSSDDGFSVVDYYAVDPVLGDWDDIADLSRDFRLMFDGVFNHISALSTWFQAFLRGEAPYTDYFIVVPPQTDLSAVVRPRTLPVLSPFETATGTKYVWTTFSPDQIDLNFANPDVLLEIVRVLLFYVERGADFVRLDAIAFLWKIIGTSCIHLEQTHTVIQIMRDVLDMVSPEVVLITETNVPHRENISYFGDGTNEAQLVYNFALPPLLLHTFRTGDATILSRWAATLELPSEHTTFFNFTASHDGIGVRPVTDILSQDDLNALVEMTREHGGYVSYRNMPDGAQSPYELNITYFDAITNPQVTATQPELAVKRFIVTQAIALALVGVPGIYFHSLFGSRNFNEGVERTGHNRAINREKLDADLLSLELGEPAFLRNMIFEQYKHLIQVRTQTPAFHPLGTQEVLDLRPAVFGLDRRSPDGVSRVIALHNVDAEPAFVSLVAHGQYDGAQDLLTGQEYTASDDILQVELAPYQVLWLVPARGES